MSDDILSRPGFEFIRGAGQRHAIAHRHHAGDALPQSLRRLFCFFGVRVKGFAEQNAFDLGRAGTAEVAQLHRQALVRREPVTTRMERADEAQLALQQLNLGGMLDIFPRRLGQRRKGPMLHAGGEERMLFSGDPRPGRRAGFRRSRRRGRGVQLAFVPGSLSSRLTGTATGGGGTANAGLSGGGGASTSMAR